MTDHFTDDDPRARERSPFLSAITGKRRKYTGAELRAIRATKGVGKNHAGKERFEPEVDAWCRQAVNCQQMALGARCYGGKRGTYKLKPFDGA